MRSFGLFRTFDTDCLEESANTRRSVLFQSTSFPTSSTKIATPTKIRGVRPPRAEAGTKNIIFQGKWGGSILQCAKRFGEYASDKIGEAWLVGNRN